MAEPKWVPPPTVKWFDKTFDVCPECSYIVERCHCIKEEKLEEGTKNG